MRGGTLRNLPLPFFAQMDVSVAELQKSVNKIFLHCAPFLSSSRIANPPELDIERLIYFKTNQSQAEMTLSNANLPIEDQSNTSETAHISTSDVAKVLRITLTQTNHS